MPHSNCDFGGGRVNANHCFLGVDNLIVATRATIFRMVVVGGLVAAWSFQSLRKE